MHMYTAVYRCMAFLYAYDMDISYVMHSAAYFFMPACYCFLVSTVRCMPRGGHRLTAQSKGIDPIRNSTGLFLRHAAGR